MNKTKTNIIANFAGKIVVAFLGIVFVPVYLRYLSVEVYGIIGFFTSIQAFLFLLDGGISPTLNREAARLSAFPEKAQELRDLSRTLEILCWVIAFAACVIALIISPIAANYWLNSENIPAETVRESLVIMSITFAFQWSLGFYTGGLYGLQEQKLLNIINIISAVFRSFGAFLVLAYVSPTIQAFLIWQLITNAFNCFSLVLFFWKKLPRTMERARFNIVLLKQVWRYAAGIAGMTVVVLILTQTDKLILSKILTLEDFGYYSLAITLAGTAISMIVGSISSVYFPQFSQLVAQEKLDELRPLYHRACQVMSFFLIPTVCVLAFFSYEILLIWTGKTEIAENTYILLTLVSIGTGLNGLMYLPQYAQFAFGITKIGFWQNVIAIIFLVPFMIYATLHYGAVGGALCWALLNFSYTTIGLSVMHRVILQGELKKWYLTDVGLPLIPALIINAAAYFLLSAEASIVSSPVKAAVFIAIIFILTLISSLISIPTMRNFFIRRILRFV